MLKPDLQEILLKQWSGAGDALARAERLWFIGYSFPESDSFMRFFLAASLASNSHLRQIAVLDPSLDVIETRAKSLFSAPQLA